MLKRNSTSIQLSQPGGQEGTLLPLPITRTSYPGRAMEVLDIRVDEGDNSWLAAQILATSSSKSSSLCSIYRVPPELSKGNEHRFNPVFVSIGPYNYNKQTFKFTEKHKKWYLQDLFSRSTPPPPPETNNRLMKDMIKAIQNLEAQARECYAEVIELESHEFVSMMVVDGCFILELLYKFKERLKSDGKLVNDPQDDIDPAFHGDGSVAFALRREIILLENQLPILVLNCLFELTKDPNHNCSLNELIITCLGALLPRNPVPGDYLIQSNKHILDLMRNMILGSQETAPRGYSIWAENSVTDLQEVGIKLKAKENATSLLDITFNEDDGVLEIPVFCIGEGIGTLIPNIIALEQTDLYNTNQIMSYTYLLFILAISDDDVELLSRRGIINRMGWNVGEACCQIADLNYGILCQPFHYDELCNRMDTYCRSDWMRLRKMLHKWKETLKRDYFGSPWAVISFFAAVVLLVLTLTQTIYSIKAYSPPQG